jgi:GNAT superfamily N-acetyltransferase
MCAHLDMSDPDLIGRVRAAGHHLRPLEAYLGGLPVLEEAEIRPFQRAQVREAERFLADRALWSDPDRFRPLPVPGLRGARAVATDRPFRNLLLLIGDRPVACVRGGLPYVDPGWRGRGLGALLVLISDLERGRFLCPAAYSVSGAGARRAAHALQVRIAGAPQEGIRAEAAAGA